MAVPVHARDVTLDDVLKRAEELVPRVRERASRTEQLRRVPDETMQEFLDAGPFRVLHRRRSARAQWIAWRALSVRTGCWTTRRSSVHSVRSTRWLITAPTIGTCRPCRTHAKCSAYRQSRGAKPCSAASIDS